MATTLPPSATRLPSDPLFRDYCEEFVLSLNAAGRSPQTTSAYLYALRDLEQFVVASGHSPDPETITALHIERWLADRRATKGPANAGFVHRHARPFFRWLIRRGYLTAERDPFRAVAVPKVEVKVVEVMTDDEVRAMLAVTAGDHWRSRRDRALIRVLMDTGIRRGEACGLTLDDVDMGLGVLHITGASSKGGRGRLVPLGVTARMELRAWLRARAVYLTRNGLEDSGALFTGLKGAALSGAGLYQIIERRAREAGVSKARIVHVWRHGWATRALAAGVGELDVQVLGGWRSLSMLARYTASNRAERALAGHARWSPGDSI